MARDEVWDALKNHAKQVHDEPGYCSVIGTIPHCCSRHWHCEPGKAAKDYVPKQEEGEADGKG